MKIDFICGIFYYLKLPYNGVGVRTMISCATRDAWYLMQMYNPRDLDM